jgi:hypothetical protein
VAEIERDSHYCENSVTVKENKNEERNGARQGRSSDHHPLSFTTLRKAGRMHIYSTLLVPAYQPAKPYHAINFIDGAPQL